MQHVGIMHQKITIIVVDEVPDKVRTDLGNVDMSTITTDGNIVWTCKALETTVVDGVALAQLINQSIN